MDKHVVACFVFIITCKITTQRLVLRSSATTPKVNDPGLTPSSSHLQTMQYYIHIRFEDCKWLSSHEVFIFSLSQLHLKNPFLGLIYPVIIRKLFKSLSSFLCNIHIPNSITFEHKKYYIYLGKYFWSHHINIMQIQDSCVFWQTLPKPKAKVLKYEIVMTLKT